MEALQTGGWYASVDYLRCTWKRRDDYEHLIHDLRHATHSAGHRAGDARTRTEASSLLCYKGVKTGSAFVGSSEQGLLLQASGLSAQYLAESGLSPDNTPRIDIQVTVWLPLPVPGVAKLCAEDAISARQNARGRKVKIRSIEGYGDGDTCYIGTRGKKSKFLRIYDKHAESGSAEYRNAWRYEAELTDHHAVAVHERLTEEGFDGQTVAAIVTEYFRERGVTLPPTIPQSMRAVHSLPEDKSSAERRMNWLRTQVRPSIDKMISDGVYFPDILEALGLLGVMPDE